MEIKISTGQWISAIVEALEQSKEGDCLLLPSMAHVHAYEIAKSQANYSKQIKVRVQ